MGYYSDTAIRCTKGVYDRLREVIEEFEFHPDKVIKTTTGLGTDRYTLVWYNAKWYQDDEDYFPEIAAIHKVLKSFEHCRAIKEGWCLSRIGDDYDDIETLWSDYTDDCYIPIKREFTLGEGEDIK